MGLHSAVRARPSEGCMGRMGRCTSPNQVNVMEAEKALRIRQIIPESRAKNKMWIVS